MLQILLVQVKGGKSGEAERRKALAEIEGFRGTYTVNVEAL